METLIVAPRPPLPAEEQARADFYALLGRLFADAPDAALLSAIAHAAPLGVDTRTDGADTAAPSVPAAWDALRAASAAMDADAVAEEYNNLFIGVGKSEINLHASHWLSGFMMDKPLVDVRATLARLGLARRAGVAQLEDHLASLCETMRILIVGQDERAPFPLSEQRAVFERHIAPWIFACCTAIQACPVANYYVRVAQLAERYMALERDSFAME